MSGETETRRSARSTKGQHKALEQLDQPVDQPKRKGKKGKKATIEKEEEPEEEIIRCVCGATEQGPASLDEPWIACDKCTAWQHNICMGMSIYSEDLGDVYFCEQCKPENHKELLDGIARGERPWEARRKAHEEEIQEEEEAERRRKKKKGPKKILGKRHSDQSHLEEPKSSQKSGKSSASPAPEKRISSAKGSAAERKRHRDASADTTSKAPPSKLRKVTDGQAVAVPAPAATSSAPIPGYEPPSDLPDKITELLDKRQGPARALYKSLTHAINVVENNGAYSPSDGVSNESRAERLAIAIERALHDSYLGKGPTAYGSQARTLAHNLKHNQELIMRLLNHTLTPPILAAMSTEELASKELQQETAEMKARAEKQSILTQDETTGPRIRRTHKGDELIDDDSAAANYDETPSLASRAALRIDKPGESSKTAELAQSPKEAPAGPPTRASTTGDPMQIDTHQSPPKNSFNIDEVYSSIKSPTEAQQRRRPSAPAHLTGPGDDPEVDRLLQEDGRDSPDYEPREESDSDVVWRGQLSMPSIANLSVTAKHVGGANLAKCLDVPWTILLPNRLSVAGRITEALANEYLCGLRYSLSADVVVASLTPGTEAGKAGFNTLVDYFIAKKRYGVVGEKGVPNIRDTYLVPVLAGTAGHPEFILNLDEHVIPYERAENMLLLVIVYRNDNATMDRLHGANWREKNTGVSLSPALSSATPTPAPGSGPASFARRDQSFSTPTFSPTTPQIGAGGQQGPWSTQTPSQLQQTPPHHYQSMPQPTPVILPGSPALQQQQPQQPTAGVPSQAQPVQGQQPDKSEQQLQGEANARNILGPLISSPTINFLLPHAAKMRLEEWHVIKKIFEQEPKSRDDLNFLSLLLEKVGSPKQQSQQSQHQHGQAKPPLAPAAHPPHPGVATTYSQSAPSPQTVTPVPPAPPASSMNTPPINTPRPVKQTPIPLPNIPGMAKMAQQTVSHAASNPLQSPSGVSHQQAAAATSAPPA